MKRTDTLFRCASAVFGSQQVLAAADAWGELASLHDSARVGLACLAAAREHDLACDDDALQSASEAFRRARGLKNGELTRAWMARWQVSVEEFGDYLERAELARHRPQLQPHLRPELVSQETLDDILWPEAVFTSHAEHWCEALARRAAAAFALGDSAALMAPLPHGLPLLDAALDRFSARVLTREATQAALESHWRDYLIFELEFGHFASVESAREARLCLEEDGAELVAVCAEAGGTHRRARALHMDLPEVLRTAALSCAPGAVLPPVELSGEHVLCRVLAKDAPDLKDPATLSRVREVLVADALRPVIAEQLVWPPGDAE